jgi:DnaJ-class molecular chaperone
MHYRMAAYYGQADKEDAGLESIACKFPNFRVRYASMLIEIQKALSRGMGLERTHALIVQTSADGGPVGASQHLEALAASFHQAFHCKDCKNGRIVCGQCQGKARIDLNCAACNGEGRVRPSGAVGNTDVMVKCRNCDGKKVFRDAGCPGCSKTGTILCGSCKGRTWRETGCSVPGCRAGRVPCSDCLGIGWQRVDCSVCSGKGRVRAPGAVGDADVTQKCRNCEIDGQTGTGKFKRECRTCQRTGKVACESCLKSRSVAAPAVASGSEVFRTQPCKACGGSGWPHPRIAIACASCVGLGVQIKPVTNPECTLDPR